MPAYPMLHAVYPPRIYPGSDRCARAVFVLPNGAGITDGGTLTIGGVVYQFIESAPFTGDVLVPFNAAWTADQVAESFATLVNIGNGGQPIEAVATPGGRVTLTVTSPGQGGNFPVSSSFLIPPAIENFAGGASFGDYLNVAQFAMVDPAKAGASAIPLRWGLSRGFQARRFGDPQYDREVLPDVG